MWLMRACAVVVVWLAACSACVAEPADQPPRSVLILDQSTHFGPWPNAIIRAVRSSVLGDAKDVTFYAEHLDLFRFNGDRYQSSLQDHFREKYRDKPIGVIVVIGTTALDYALNLRAALWPAVQIVFAAVEEGTVERSLPPGVTGITMEMTLASMMKAAQLVVPGLKGFAIVGSPLEQQIYYRRFAQELPSFSRDFQFINLMGLSVDEVRQRVSALPDHTAILYIGINFYQRTTYVAAEVLPLIAEVTNRPIIVNAETFLGTGAVGGFILTPNQIGEAAGRIASRILGGENAASIPIAGGDAPRPIFDWRQLERWNVSESRLPVGSEIRFHERSIWQQYREQSLEICAVLLTQAALIMWLAYEHRRRHAAEVRARTTMSELAQMNRVAMAGELSATIAHEINQPLTGISTRASAALRWLTAEVPDVVKAKAALEQIEKACQRTGDIIQSVRAMFRKDTHVKGRVDINKLALSVLELARIELQRNKIDVRMQLDNRLPPVTGNMVQLQQVILNLAMNAIDSMNSVYPRVMSVKSGLNKTGDVVISIEDSGIGISPADRERVFDPLFTTKKDGMGMGLSICRSIVEGHNGTISVSAGEVRGTIFQVVLPAKSGTRRSSHEVPSPPLAGADNRLGDTAFEDRGPRRLGHRAKG